MTKKKAIAQLENLKEHCNEMSKSNILWESDVIALDIAIKELKKDTVLRESHEERRENNVKAYMEIKNKINDCERVG